MSRDDNNNNHEIDNNLLTLSLSFPSPTVQPPQPHVQPPPPPPQQRRPRKRKLSNISKNDTVSPPYPWATNKRAIVHSLNVLYSNQIFTIKGDVQCKRCEKKYEMEFNLREKFEQIGTFIALNKASMHDRAPDIWMNPIFPTCKFCKQENSVKPIIATKKKEINWLFLLLGQFLGCCTLEQLKYFCKHNKNHRTGAKDRVLYLTYLTLCRQLDSSGPFDR
ncbi:uncharacterized protein LOC132634848 [Lycium barbarum]|uniref:uncharacterized protein LOC132634848 n=1 Tax=Lycium barbarum TaxID=112863 RepID=UPI00293F6390|nr:uncharacterized protein LOC132634848 [Lycium barbarum]XP_060206943.1 uncharacterized protein LOC132634848 [Lycium barbarum]XP_060206944.1 uncharacterized protein LOC132634848 [Lycium barbarum]